MAKSPLPPLAPDGGDTSKRLHHPWLSGGDIKMATLPLPSPGPHVGDRSEWLHHPYLLWVPMVGTDQNG